MKPAGTLRRKFGKIIVGFFATILLGWGSYYLSNWAFTIAAIEVVGEHTHVIIDQKRISRNLLFFPSDVFRSQVLASNPWLADVRFEKKFPGTLRIVPILRTPAAILQSHDRIVLIDQEGIVISDGDGGNTLPKLVIPTEPFRVGEKLNDARVILALSLMKNTNSDLSFTRITYENGSYLRATTEKTDIIVTHQKSPTETLATLQMLVSGFRIKGTLPKIVDLRFDKPIVTF